jgi:hypothetical protein
MTSTVDVIEVWPIRSVKKHQGKRQYLDSNGNIFVGTHRAAYVYYTELHSSCKINLNTAPNSK